ncbi:hypothetical protein PCYB_032990, partial [Plasmodium cynomolgi strain B]
SYTFVESWDSAACQENAVRTSRLLTGHTLIGNTQGGQYAHLKNKLIDLLDEENDAFGKSLNDLVHDEVFRNTFSNLMHEDSFQKKSYRNLDASFDDVRRKYKHFMKKFRVYLPPTINMGILMLMLVFKSTLYYTNIFAFLSFTFFAMISYYGYKFAKLQRIRESYKSFDRKKGFRKPIKY